MFALELYYLQSNYQTVKYHKYLGGTCLVLEGVDPTPLIVNASIPESLSTLTHLHL